MRGRIRTLVLAATAVAVPLMAASCGTKPAAAGILGSAVANTAATSSKVSMSVTMSGTGMTTTLTSEGEFDYASRLGVLRMGGMMPGQEIRFLPPKLYVKVSGDGMPLPKGKSWIEVTVPGQGAAAGLMGSPFSGMGSSPSDLLTALTAISSKVTDLGPGIVRGVAVTHYRVTVDLAKAAAKMPAPERSNFGDFTGMLGTSTLPVDVWVDDQTMVRRVSIALPMPKGQGLPFGFQVTETVDFYDFGLKVVVTAPPASQIMSQSEYDAAMSSGVSSGGGSFGGGPGTGTPPPVSGTLTAAQASAAEQATRAFWTAISDNSVTGIQAAVLPSQRGCVASFIRASRVTFKVTAFQVTKATPAGTGKATVWFTANATIRMGTMTVPMEQADASNPDWLVVTESGGAWYVDVNSGSGALPGC